MRGFLFVMVSLSSLMGCDQQAPRQTEGGDPTWKPPEAAVEVPEAIKKIAATPFPADGEIHLIASKGRVNIKPETRVCYFPDGFALDNNKLFDALGQPSYFSWGARIQPAAKGRCEFPDDVVLIQGKPSDNRNGTPYKLVLAVWQGDVATDRAAYWVAGIERLNGLRPEHVEIASEDPVNLKSYSGASSGRDMGDLSQKFVIFVTGKQAK